MGKIVKYCSSCDEGFSEKFGFCPNCAAPLQAFEMNPVDGVSKPVEEPMVTKRTIEVAPITNVVREQQPKEAFDTENILEMPGDMRETAPVEVANADIIDEEISEPEYAPEQDEPVWAAPATIPSASTYEGKGFHNYEPGRYTKEDDGGYYVTVIQEKNVAQRNLLLLGASIFMLTLVSVGFLVSLFQKELGVGAIGDDRSLALLLDDVPMPVEEEEKKDKEDAGGGGGGGKNDPKPVNQGDPPDQTPNPIRPPDPKIPKLTNPDLVLPPPSTQGNQKTEKKFTNWGEQLSKYNDLSSGPGSGGGMGSGIGTGAGSGRGTGMGSGSGSGAGSGDGDGYGDGSGAGRGGLNPPPPKPVGVTSPMRIISKPQAKYNDAGRANQVQGTVRLKVTLLANGSVGSITPVTRLPHGMTEQAIAAARLIRFEPKKVNGQPVAVTVTFDYSFSLY